MKYPINEIFQTIQCEGYNSGQPAIFIRLQGCNMGCTWCDTKHTWALDEINKVSYQEVTQKNASDPNQAVKWTKATVNDILKTIKTNKWLAKLVVITGGEPAMYNLLPLCIALEEQGLRIQLETSGAYQIRVTENTWVCVSPKINVGATKPILKSALQRANEIKHPVSNENDIKNLKNILMQLTNKPKIFLQPVSTDKQATQIAVDNCLKENWRLSLQMHKYIGIE